MQLSGATVVITGASHGIGRTTAEALAKRGAMVVGVGRDTAALEDVARLTGGTSVTSDVADPDHARTVVEHTLREHGRIDGVVLNAGVGWAGSFTEMSPERIATLLDVNVRAPMLLTREVAPRMVAQGRGALVFVTSIAGLLPVAGEAVYSSTKTALEFFAEAIRQELHGTGVAVSSVSPGVVSTDFFDNRGRPYDRRWPRPIASERIADAVVDVMTTGKAHRTEPRWLEMPARLRGIAPGLYRTMSRLGS